MVVSDGFWDFSLTKVSRIEPILFPLVLYFSADRFWYVTLDSTTTLIFDHTMGKSIFWIFLDGFFWKIRYGFFCKSVLFLVIEHCTNSWNCHFLLWCSKSHPYLYPATSKGNFGANLSSKRRVPEIFEPPVIVCLNFNHSCPFVSLENARVSYHHRLHLKCPRIYNQWHDRT